MKRNLYYTHRQSLSISKSLQTKQPQSCRKTQKNKQPKRAKGDRKQTWFEMVGPEAHRAHAHIVRGPINFGTKSKAPASFFWGAADTGSVDSSAAGPLPPFKCHRHWLRNVEWHVSVDPPLDESMMISNEREKCLMFYYYLFNHTKSDM